jgi:prepilin-type N-terminal cleavage/methylation domain-containing protein
MNTKSKKGFSLVEILIVITIMGILMAMITPAYKGIASKGRAVKCQANLKNLYTATMLYAKDRGDSRLPNAFSRVWWNDNLNIVDGRTGWVHWSADKDYEEVYANFALGVTQWSGDDGYFSVTNGRIWQYSGESIEAYSCPEFKIFKFKTTPPGDEEIYRTYVYNSSIDERVLFNVSNLSSTLMFGEGSRDILTASNGGSTGEGWDNENMWDGCFMPSQDNEVLGNYHNNGTSFIVFCDGHIETLRKTDDKDILLDLCAGTILKRSEF